VTRLPGLLLASVLTSLAFGDQVDDYIRDQMKTHRVPGVVVEIARDGRVLKRKAYGVADIELNVPMRTDYIFEIGSITKQFTSVAVLQLMEQGKLSLTDTLGKYIPDAPETWQKITIRNLLNQNSGLKDYALIKGIGLLDEFDQATFLKTIEPLPLDFPTGVTWAYSNTNYALLGIVIEKASGETYTNYLTERVLKPAGLRETMILDPDAIIPRRAQGYYDDGKKLIRARPSMVSILSDGALVSTADDLTQWEAALRGGKLLQPGSYHLMTSPGPLNNGRTRQYGAGIYLESLGEKPFLGHPGASSGYSAGVSYFPTDHMSVVVLTNVYAIDGLGWVKDIGRLEDPSLISDPLTVQPDPNPARTERIKSALDKLGAGTVDADLMDPDVTAIMDGDRIKVFGNPFTRVAGIRTLEFAGERPKGSDQWITYRATTDKAVLAINIIYSPAGKLGMLYVRPDTPSKARPSAASRR
jgi:CubicO group peptidase (beta-lactamase class C family)